MALHPRPEEVTPTDVHLVITPSPRGQDLYGWIALPSTASCREARRAARELRRSAQGPRLEAACLAELVLGDPARRRDYDALRARAAAAGVPMPVIGPAIAATPLGPSVEVQLRRELGVLTAWLHRVFVVVLKVLIASVLVLAGIGLIVYFMPPPRSKYEPIKIPHFDYRPVDFTIPEYVPPKLELEPIHIDPDVYRFDPPAPPPAKKPSRKKRR